MMTEEIKNRIATAQKCEITEYVIYKKLSGAVKNTANSEILLHIAQDELRHYNFWKQFTGVRMRPNQIRVWLYYLLSKIFGLTFSIKLMERGEGQAQINYRGIAEIIPEALDIAKEEDEHEAKLIEMIKEERLKYIGSIILGLNDALVELSGALAGFTLALQNSRLVAVVGLITGIAAALSMGSTGYLASKSEGSEKAPLKSALYTGISYIVTVLFLIFPYLILSNVFLALAVMIINALIIIMIFNFYIAVAKDLPFFKKFSEMALLSLGIAAISFGIGFLVRELLGVDV
jgi:VIT1/CCC1 family predicted Fe2+/Mn2+ transporter